ncbi:hypothetical protein [Streptosporangium roseum]|uniref:hypothetical protein n=1 Tax=Streptosporangium roseum TaxID=2001 RepID=UPI003332A743
MFRDSRSGYLRKPFDHAGGQQLRLWTSRITSRCFRRSHGTATEQEQSLEAAAAMPKKGSRLITVYRWRVRHKPTYRQGNSWTPPSIDQPHWMVTAVWRVGRQQPGHAFPQIAGNEIEGRHATDLSHPCRPSPTDTPLI